ncbi:MAG: FAD-dependent oxidoreductase, partial [Planctomycetaceae bacterium]
RGLWLVRMGLSLYDLFAKDKRFPRYRVHRGGSPGVPRIDPDRYRWLCSYSDAQMRYPERFVVALLEDARRVAEERGVEFRVLTHHRAFAQKPGFFFKTGLLEGEEPGFSEEAKLRDLLQPAVVVNATGAWGDLTLRELEVESPRLFGGTKGSHFVTYHRSLRDALGDDGVYAEAGDGRLVFVLPFGDGTLVGTTDERFNERPERAAASQEELGYLLGMANRLFPQAGLTETDIELHYSGVRPLPAASVATTAAISRGHSIIEHTGPPPVLTLIGGKLTTCRAFAEETADRVFSLLGHARTAGTRERPVPGGENYPASEAELRSEQERLAARFGLPAVQVQA